mgnify:CR=1 FL=1
MPKTVLKMTLDWKIKLSYSSNFEILNYNNLIKQFPTKNRKIQYKSRKRHLVKKFHFAIFRINVNLLSIWSFQNTTYTTSNFGTKIQSTEKVQCEFLSVFIHDNFSNYFANSHSNVIILASRCKHSS